jgi:hypothetical protein
MYDRSGNVVTYRDDDEHRADGERCLKILADAGMKPAIVDGYFAVVTVSPEDTDRAHQLLADAIEHQGLHVRQTHDLRAPDRCLEDVAWYSQEDIATRDRADRLLDEHKIETSGVGNAGTASISALPKDAAEARHILWQAMKNENLRVHIIPAEQQNESPGALYFVRRQTTPADQSSDGRNATRLTVIENVEVFPNGLTTKKLWSAEMPAGGVTTAWSPDARFLVFAGDVAGGSTRVFYVDVAHPQTSELPLADAVQEAEARRRGKRVVAEKIKYHTDLKDIAWSGTGVGKVPLIHGAGDEMQSNTLIVDLTAAPPKLSIE